MATPTKITAAQLITDSLVDLNVIRDNQEPTADQQAFAIRELNQMLAKWEADGYDLNYIPVGNVTDQMQVPDASYVGIRAGLAIALAPSFGTTATPELVAKYREGMETIAKITRVDVKADFDLPLPDRYRYYGSDITNG